MAARRPPARTILTRVLGLLTACLLAACLPAAHADGVPDLAEAWSSGRSDATYVCLRTDDVTPCSSEQRRLAGIFALLRRDPLIGTPLLQEAADLGVGVCLDAYDRGCDGVFEVEHGVIVLDADLGDGLTTAILVHELRHMDRARAGFTIDLAYGVAAARTLACASEADAQAMATWFAWRLRAVGDPRAFEALLAHPRYGDIAGAFEAAIALGGDEWTAARAAFARWYASDWRVRTYRFGASLTYMSRLDEAHTILSYAPLPDAYFSDFDRLPGGAVGYGAQPRPID